MSCADDHTISRLRNIAARCSGFSPHLHEDPPTRGLFEDHPLIEELRTRVEAGEAIYDVTRELLARIGVAE